MVISDDHDLFRAASGWSSRPRTTSRWWPRRPTAQEAVARVEELAPDVVLMDVRMPRMGGIEATRLIRQLFPTTRIIVLTVSDEEDDLFGAVKAGANGYLLKEVSIEEVADAVRAVFAGQSLISPSLASKLLAEFSGPGQGRRRPAVSAPARLTEREVEVLKLVALGHDNAEIAAQLRRLGEHGAQPRGQHPDQAPAPVPDRTRDLSVGPSRSCDGPPPRRARTPSGAGHRRRRSPARCSPATPASSTCWCPRSTPAPTPRTSGPTSSG